MGGSQRVLGNEESLTVDMSHAPKKSRRAKRAKGQRSALALGTGYASLKDTPNRYIYREIWGMSAKMALGFISSLRKAYPQLSEELDAEQRFFEDALLKHNNVIRP